MSQDRNLPDVPYAQLHEMIYQAGLLSTDFVLDRPAHSRKWVAKPARRRWTGRGRS